MRVLMTTMQLDIGGAETERMVMRGSFLKELLKIQRRLLRNAAGRRFCRQERRRKRAAEDFA